MRPFEGIKILDCTHVLAGPFAAYQLAVLGADVIKVDDPNEPDQSRESGADHSLNKALMGTGFLTQGSNKRAIALNLKTEGGREALKRLVAEWADVLVENYRPGAFKALGLGYEDLARIKPTLIYASMTAFGQEGPRGTQTAYDHAIQATSGITASTGTEASGPIKVGAPMVDYATGTMGAFAISAALFQRLRTGQGQYIDMAMLDVAMILQGSHITDYLHSGHHPKRGRRKGEERGGERERGGGGWGEGEGGGRGRVGAGAGGVRYRGAGWRPRRGSATSTAFRRRHSPPLIAGVAASGVGSGRRPCAGPSSPPASRRSRGRMTPPGALAVDRRVVDAGRDDALSRSALAALISRRRVRMTIASEVPRCSWVRS